MSFSIKSTRIWKQIFFSVAILAAVPGVALAGPCGQGKIIEIQEGGWNWDGIGILLEGPNSSIGDSTKQVGWSDKRYVMFKASHLSESRLDSIRRLASMAFAMDLIVWTNSHTGACNNATELKLFR